MNFIKYQLTVFFCRCYVKIITFAEVLSNS